MSSKVIHRKEREPGNEARDSQCYVFSDCECCLQINWASKTVTTVVDVVARPDGERMTVHVHMYIHSFSSSLKTSPHVHSFAEHIRMYTALVPY